MDSTLSTEYRPTWPATSVRATEAPGRFRRAVWLGHGRRAYLAGFRSDELIRFALWLAGASSEQMDAELGARGIVR